VRDGGGSGGVHELSPVGEAGASSGTAAGTFMDFGWISGCREGAETHEFMTPEGFASLSGPRGFTADNYHLQNGLTC